MHEVEFLESIVNCDKEDIVSLAFKRFYEKAKKSDNYPEYVQQNLEFFVAPNSEDVIQLFNEKKGEIGVKALLNIENNDLYSEENKVIARYSEILKDEIENFIKCYKLSPKDIAAENKEFSHIIKAEPNNYVYSGEYITIARELLDRDDKFSKVNQCNSEIHFCTENFEDLIPSIKNSSNQSFFLELSKNRAENFSEIDIKKYQSLSILSLFYLLRHDPLQDGHNYTDYNITPNNVIKYFNYCLMCDLPTQQKLLLRFTDKLKYSENTLFYRNINIDFDIIREMPELAIIAHLFDKKIKLKPEQKCYFNALENNNISLKELLNLLQNYKSYDSFEKFKQKTNISVNDKLLTMLDPKLNVKIYLKESQNNEKFPKYVGPIEEIYISKLDELADILLDDPNLVMRVDYEITEKLNKKQLQDISDSLLLTSPLTSPEIFIVKTEKNIEISKPTITILNMLFREKDIQSFLNVLDLIILNDSKQCLLIASEAMSQENNLCLKIVALKYLHLNNIESHMEIKPADHIEDDLLPQLLIFKIEHNNQNISDDQLYFLLCMALNLNLPRHLDEKIYNYFTGKQFSKGSFNEAKEQFNRSFWAKIKENTQPKKLIHLNAFFSEKLLQQDDFYRPLMMQCLNIKANIPISAEVKVEETSEIHLHNFHKETIDALKTTIFRGFRFLENILLENEPENTYRLFLENITTYDNLLRLDYRFPNNEFCLNDKTSLRKALFEFQSGGEPIFNLNNYVAEDAQGAAEDINTFLASDYVDETAKTNFRKNLTKMFSESKDETCIAFILNHNFITKQEKIKIIKCNVRKDFIIHILNHARENEYISAALDNFIKNNFSVSEPLPNQEAIKTYINSCSFFNKYSIKKRLQDANALQTRYSPSSSTVEVPRKYRASISITSTNEFKFDGSFFSDIGSGSDIDSDNSFGNSA